MLIIRGVNVFPTQIEEQILRLPALAPHYQIEVSRNGNLDEFMVAVERNPDTDAALSRTAAADLQCRIKDLVGVSAKIEVRDPGAIPRSEGKARRVIDKRNPG